MNDLLPPAEDVIAYYKHFKGVLGAMTWVFAAVPAASALLPSDAGIYLFPPLGAMNWTARVGAVVIMLIATFVAYVLSGGNRPRRVVVMFIVGLVSFVAFFLLSLRLVRTIEIPSRNSSIVVSIGYHRTEFARSNFPQDTDEEMIRQSGPRDEDIKKLWTPWSVDLARLALFLSCLSFLLSWTFTLSFGVLLANRPIS